MRKKLEHAYQTLIETYGFQNLVNADNINLILGRTLTSFIDNHKRVAIYGYGIHTEMLMADFMVKLRGIEYIIENYADQSESPGFHLIREEQIEECGIDAVIISSYKFKDSIIDSLKRNHPAVKYLDLYRAFEQEGICLKGEYYNQVHPYHHYRKINEIQRRISTKTGPLRLTESYHELLSEYLQIKDFRTAIVKAEELNSVCSTPLCRQLIIDLKELYHLEQTAARAIGEHHVLMLCLDGLRRQDLLSGDMPGLSGYLEEHAYMFEHAYSYSTSTYESLVPVYGENSDLKTAYFKHSSIPEQDCRFMRKAREQNRTVYFYTDMSEHIESPLIKRSGSFQTVTEKLWDFILDGLEETNGLFYLHVLYESHFSYSNPYTRDKLNAEGTSILFDFLDKKGGALRADYRQQHQDALHYLDDVMEPLIRCLKCRTLLYADHGNLLLDKGTRKHDLLKTQLTFHEDLLRIPLLMVTPEMGRGTDARLISLMSLNDMVIAMMEQTRFDHPEHHDIKVGRSELYHPDFRYLYKSIGLEHGLLAFEGFIFQNGDKLIIYADGAVELYHIKDDLVINNIEKKESLLQSISSRITVCGPEHIRLTEIH